MRTQTADKWDLHFFRLAEQWAGMSKDPSTKVGAVIVNSRRRVVSQGYNGLPEGCDDTALRLQDREWKMQRMIHAEMNVILNAVGSVHGGHLYITPLPPCTRCAAMLGQAGIRTVACHGHPIPERWVDDMTAAALVLESMHVILRFTSTNGREMLLPRGEKEIREILTGKVV